MWNSQEIKSVKNAIIKKSIAKAFQVCISLVHDSFILEFSISISISTVTGISINITVISISISTALLLGRYRKIRTSFKTLVSKKTTIWWLKKSHSNNKLLEKTTPSSYQMEQKTFIEISCIYNIHAGEKNFCSCCFWRFVSRLDSDRWKNSKCTLVCTSLLLLL